MTPVSQPTPALPLSRDELRRRFEQLADEWERAVAYLSDSTLREAHPAYQAIIALGPAVVPLLLADLERTHRHWFGALTELTGANPVALEDAGRIRRMAEAWARWGREQGYSW
ncbi:MAG: hypothetical protein L0Z62_15460 [Gemmataceae bacterium]|nr:hypothetical protein [Gemmataceae bacterium]